MELHDIPDPADQDNRYDVFVTVGAETHALADSFIWAIDRMAQGIGVPQANTYAIGHGQWGEERERSGFLLYTNLTSEQVRGVKDCARVAGINRKQEAVGVAIVPAGSALVYCIEGK